VVYPPARRATHQGRPARKYEIPAGRKMSLDIHPRVRPNLANPALPLFVSEGSRKVDALITAGARAVVGVIGVWTWRGPNDDDGLALLPDWEFVALKEGRQVFVVYDSDIIFKQPVALAMNRLGAALRRMGAEVAYTRLPSGEGGARSAPTTSSPPAARSTTSCGCRVVRGPNRRRRRCPPVGVPSRVH
jgi:hypothetical protein